MKNSLTFLLLTIFLSGYAQQERIFLDIDRSSYLPGDTIYMKAYVADDIGLSSISTNLYVYLCQKNGTKISSSLFPLFHGMARGNVVLDTSLATDNYYLVAFTRNQFNYDSLSPFNRPIVLYNPEKPGKLLQYHYVGDQYKGVSSRYNDLAWSGTTIADSLLMHVLKFDVSPHSYQLMDNRSDSTYIVNFEIDSLHDDKYVLFPRRDSIRNAVDIIQDNQLIGKMVVPAKSEKGIRVEMKAKDVSPFGSNVLDIEMPDSDNYYLSISVTDADRSSSAPVDIKILEQPFINYFKSQNAILDTSYLTFEGNATREYGKVLKNLRRELLVAGVKDTQYLFMKTVPIAEDGHIKIDSLFFYGRLGLDFNMNNHYDLSAVKDISLHFTSPHLPSFDSSIFSNVWATDEAAVVAASDTVISKVEKERIALSKIKTLKTVIVKSWKNPRQELDAKYATGAFAEPALYVFDLRNYTSEYNRDIFHYLSGQAGFMYNVLTDRLESTRHGNPPIHFFVEQQPCPQNRLKLYDFDQIAYIKILESDFLWGGYWNEDTAITPSPIKDIAKSGIDTNLFRIENERLNSSAVTPINVLIYLRKGTDFRTLRGAGMRSVSVKGYDAPYEFHPNLTTLYWAPWEMGHTFHVLFANSQNCHRFRLRINGISATGNVISKEMVIE